MKSTSTKLLLVIALLPCLARPARAEMVAGWDFSQWFVAGVLSTDGMTLTNVLPANYSNLDPTFGAGAESADFGMMYLDGEFGSTEIIPDASGTEAMIPRPGSLDSNLDAGVPLSIEFDAFTVLQSEGQEFQNLLSMIANSPVSVVFQADLSSIAETRGNWSVSFGGQTEEGTSTVSIDFSTDGSSYTQVGEVELTATDALYEVDLGSDTSDMAFVRFNFNPDSVDSRPFIDNVAILAPEPSQALGVLSVLLALWSLRSLQLRDA